MIENWREQEKRLRLFLSNNFLTLKHCFFSISLKTLYTKGSIITLTLQVVKLRHKERKQLHKGTHQVSDRPR